MDALAFVRDEISREEVTVLRACMKERGDDFYKRKRFFILLKLGIIAKAGDDTWMLHGTTPKSWISGRRLARHKKAS